MTKDEKEKKKPGRNFRKVLQQGDWPLSDLDDDFCSHIVNLQRITVVAVVISDKLHFAFNLIWQKNALW